MHLPVGNYYVKELYAGLEHELDARQFPFTFDGNNQDQVININVADEGEKPILNKLYFNQFSFIKENEKAILHENKGYTYDFSASGKGAVFTLEDEEGTIIQMVSADEKSLVTFENVPVGTFLLKEKEASSVDYVVSKQVIKIVSTLEGITAYDEKGEVLSLKNKKAKNAAPETKETTHSNSNARTTAFEPVGESPEISEEIPKPEEAMEPLFSLKNLLKKGTVELTKKDISTAEPLPKTGIRILAENEKLVIEGRTDEKGQFKFKQLPAGKYTFKEFDAPKDYELDETPLPFEITEDGEIVKCEMTNKKATEETKPNKPQPKEKGLLPSTGEQKRNSFILIIGLLLVISAAGVISCKASRKNSK